jgi:hypothetical protein
MAEKAKKTGAVRRATKPAAASSTTGETAPHQPVRKVKAVAAEPVAEAPSKSTASRPGAKKTTTRKVLPKPAEKPVLFTQTAEVLVMRSPAKAEPLNPEEIARLAYLYWLERGRVHGHHDEDWARAERELRTADLLQKAS